MAACSVVLLVDDRLDGVRLALLVRATDRRYDATRFGGSLLCAEMFLRIAGNPHIGVPARIDAPLDTLLLQLGVGPCGEAPP